MPTTHTPWAGLAAIAIMFLLPFLPSWLFEGPRTIKHWPRRHVCGECGALWRDDHLCTRQVIEPSPRLRGELRRLSRTTALEPRRPRWRIVR